jgi:murein hydrolase activator
MAFFNPKILLVFINLTFVVSFGYTQQINELKEKKKQIEKEIESINELISKTDKESKNSISNVKLTKRKIELKNSLIKQIDNESEQLKYQISSRKRKIDSLYCQIDIIKNDYRKLIIYTQKTKSKNNLLLLLLSSKDFNQAYKRIKFYQQIFKFKTQIVDRFNSTIITIRDENSKLTDNINLLSKRQNEKIGELQNLKIDEKIFVQKVKILSNKRKELLGELEEQKRVTKKINSEIERLIEEEARKEAEISRNKNKNNDNTKILLSNNFKDNIGKFKLPVNNGIITGNYGESFHPVLKEIKVKNNGVDITLPKKSDVFSIYKGEVKKIFKLPGSSLAIIIRHGRYLSVYSNLSTINVNVGQNVNSYQKIGEINLQKGEETAILHFELWNETKTEDPAKWFISN